MIDLHNHIIYGIDDGSKSLEMSLSMAKIAVSEGIDTIVATPHYIYGANSYIKEEMLAKCSQLNEQFENEGIELTILPGNELMIDDFIAKDLIKEKCNTMNGSRYVLVEFPQIGIPKSSESIIYSILQSGFVPIIAHPERYTEFQISPIDSLKLVDMGCILQINSTSITGLAGKIPQKTAKILLESNGVHLVASDAHSDNRRAPRLMESKRMVEQWLGSEAAEKIFEENPKLIIQNKELEKKLDVKIRQKTLIQRLFKSE